MKAIYTRHKFYTYIILHAVRDCGLSEGMKDVAYKLSKKIFELHDLGP